MTGPPGYWMYETTGVLAPVIRAYLAGDTLDGAQVATFRAYLRQWMLEMVGPEAAELRRRLDSVTDTDTLRRWLYDALDIGIDPL